MNSKIQQFYMRTQTAPPEESTQTSKDESQQILTQNQPQPVIQQQQLNPQSIYQNQQNQYQFQQIQMIPLYQQQQNQQRIGNQNKQFEYLPYPPNIQYQKIQQLPQNQGLTLKQKLQKKSLKINSVPFSLNSNNINQNKNLKQNPIKLQQQKELQEQKQKLQAQLKYQNKYKEIQENQVDLQMPVKLERVPLDRKKLEELAKIQSKYSPLNANQTEQNVIQQQLIQNEVQQKQVEGSIKQNNQIIEQKKVDKSMQLKKIIEEKQEEIIEEKIQTVNYDKQVRIEENNEQKFQNTNETINQQEQEQNKDIKVIKPEKLTSQPQNDEIQTELPQSEILESKQQPKEIQNEQKEENTGPSAIQQLLFQGQKQQPKPQSQPQHQQISRSQQQSQQQSYGPTQAEEKGINQKYKSLQEQAENDFKKHKVDPKVSTFEFSEDHINMDQTLNSNQVISGTNFSQSVSLQKNYQIQNPELLKQQQRYQQFKKQIVHMQQKKMSKNQNQKSIKSNPFQNTQQQQQLQAQLQAIQQYTQKLQQASFTSTLIIQRQPEDPLKVSMQESCNKWFSSKQVEKKDELKKFKTEVRFQLNILTPQNLSGIQQVLSRQAETHDHYQEIVKQIIEKAQSEPKYTKVYAELCSYLQKTSKFYVKDPQENPQKKTTTQASIFKNCLLGQIQTIFEGDASAEDTENQNQKKAQQDDVNELGYKRKLLGNVRFIGELYVVQVIKRPVINICTYQIIRNFLYKYAHGHQINSQDELNEAENSLERILILYHQVGHLLEKIFKTEENKAETQKVLQNLLRKLEGYFIGKDYEKILKWDEETYKIYSEQFEEKKAPADFYTINFTFEMFKIFKKNSDLSKRMKCLLENILQRRSENWKQFLSTLEGPKKLQELRDEFQQEQFEAVKQAQKVKEQQQLYKHDYQKQRVQTQYQQKQGIAFQSFYCFHFKFLKVVNETQKEEEKQNLSPVIDYTQYEKNPVALNFKRDLNYQQNAQKPTQTQQKFTVKKLNEAEIKAKLIEIYQKYPTLDEQTVLSLFTNSTPQLFMEQFFNSFYDAGEKEIQMRLKIPELLFEKQQLKETEFLEEFNKFLSISANELQSDFKRMPIWCAQLCYNTFLENNLANYIQINFYAMESDSQGLDWDIIDGAIIFYQVFIKELKQRLKSDVQLIYFIQFLTKVTKQEQKLQDLRNVQQILYDYLETDFKANYVLFYQIQKQHNFIQQGDSNSYEHEFKEKLEQVGFKEFDSL